MVMRSSKFDICQDTVALNCLKSYTNSVKKTMLRKVLVFVQKKDLSDVGSKIHFVQRNIVSIEKSVWTWKKYYVQACI